MITKTAAHPDPTDASDMVAGDYPQYVGVLSDLGNQCAALDSALLEARSADTTQTCRDALVDLHIRLRRMAATANHALGPRSPSPDVQP
ncbi:hypothetical protein [Actinoplanes auranticolor]|uniref:Uncharacterized protein n=1 Tax=Actinoplanes auranticolor TaxID=47988 RepID=A0A919STF1_9ACTN|nr:hypothetical protein [Actinoplanes auranticolor]GIM77609.1 hypothetical protein Aau02nite_76750 [Actinoplanes auranticolor]